MYDPRLFFYRVVLVLYHIQVQWGTIVFPSDVANYDNRKIKIFSELEIVDVVPFATEHVISLMFPLTIQ